MMLTYLSEHWLDILTTVLGLIYIWLEYRASIALWVVGIIMPALDTWLYWTHGLYGDAGMAVYYTLAAVYGFYIWKFKKTRKLKQSLPIIHMPRRQYLPVMLFFLLAWGAIYYVLVNWTNSTVPLLDSFTNALSFVGLWALARKYLEQWLFWIVVDAVCCYLYIQKDIPFKAILYGLYVVIAIAGYYKWKQMLKITKYDQV
jgi:nicotinamide mononucleotide transporter